MERLTEAREAGATLRKRHGFTDALPDASTRTLWCYVVNRHGRLIGFGVPVAESSTADALVIEACRRAAHALLGK